MERAGAAAAAAVGAAVTFLRRTTKKERVTSHGTRVKKKKSDQRSCAPSPLSINLQNGWIEWTAQSISKPYVRMSGRA